ncbi:hypothetical protein NITLEN_11024 [Nitrospira lenta]|uniref:Uncharacterized protein n=1 Tax=Nitrospira lenta TaxID=1436998 RepID=A0A330L2F0_9BACT|nr:hypothetical protein NITLEN_11024 [Nitrospira lenta]
MRQVDTLTSQDVTAFSGNSKEAK